MAELKQVSLCSFGLTKTFGCKDTTFISAQQIIKEITHMKIFTHKNFMISVWWMFWPVMTKNMLSKQTSSGLTKTFLIYG